jgi:hypothetical protein
MPYLPDNWGDNVFDHETDPDKPPFEMSMLKNENKEQYRERVYAANRALDLHDLKEQLLGSQMITSAGYWALRGRYSENKLAVLKEEARIWAEGVSGEDLHDFYNDGHPLVEDWNELHPELDSPWQYQKPYFDYAGYDEDGEFILTDLPAEYIAAMGAQ